MFPVEGATAMTSLFWSSRKPKIAYVKTLGTALPSAAKENNEKRFEERDGMYK